MLPDFTVEQVITMPWNRRTRCPEHAVEHVVTSAARSAQRRTLCATLVAMDRAEFLVCYQLAHAEYRAEVDLGWRRASLFVVLGMVGPALACLRDLGRDAWPACAASAAACIAGLLLVRLAHARYRSTREHLRMLEQQLRLGVGMSTTGGMREAQGKPRAERYRAVTVLSVLLALLAVLNIVIIVAP